MKPGAEKGQLLQSHLGTDHANSSFWGFVLVWFFNCNDLFVLCCKRL